jgi:hypothetical protein
VRGVVVEVGMASLPAGTTASTGETDGLFAPMWSHTLADHRPSGTLNTAYNVVVAYRR